MLTGNIVNVRAVEPTDYQHIWRWVNDPEVMLYWGRPGNTVSLAEVSALEEVRARRDDSRKYIIETTEGQAIGQIDYYNLVWEERSAWVSIQIGEPDYWGGGYGTDAMRTLLRYLFGQLGLHRVSLNVHASNLRAQRSYKKNGFVKEGVLRDWHYVNGEWVDGVVMGVLDRDFAALEV
ncbi:MAG: GNAT family N-acetyltransferase [Chloroflexi bacterium]|nr:GNAT family N-acetyltransferase [Chloroflexota bacterium]